jgi:nucleoside-diphosphate-sugar epimerase
MASLCSAGLACRSLLGTALGALDSTASRHLLADSMPMTLGEILSVLREMQGRPLTTIPIPKTVIRILLALIGRSDLWLRFAGDLVVDAGKFQALGWRPTTDTARGLAAMLETQDGQSVSAMQRMRRRL